MTQIVVVNAFRRGAGATQIAANLAASLAVSGQRVALVDADLAAPALHHLMQVEPVAGVAAVNDFLLGRLPLDAVSRDVTVRVQQRSRLIAMEPRGRLYFLPAAADADRAHEALLAIPDLDRLNESFEAFSRAFELDTIVVDTAAGANRGTLLAMALCDWLCVVLTLDRADMQGASVTLDVGRMLSAPQTSVIVNQAAAIYSEEQVRERILSVYGCNVAAVLPYAAEIAGLAGASLFVLDYPTHPASIALRQFAGALLRTASTEQAAAAAAGGLEDGGALA